ncbi:MAG: NAD(P)H-hydrate dehydratase [Thermodesulfobacteriota bacterium]
MYLVSTNEMREMDRLAIESFGLPGRILMENAGKGATEVLLECFPEVLHQKVGIIAGRGNNGGDGFVVARYLARNRVDVKVFVAAHTREVKGEAALNLELLPRMNIPIIEIADRNSFLTHADEMRGIELWVDALFGTGIHSTISGYCKELIEFINSLKRPILSIDTPSGLDSDTGHPCGVCIHADVTVTFGFPKIGQILYPGALHTGRLEIIDIGIPPPVIDEVTPLQKLITPEMIGSILKSRPMDAHKGDTGHLLVVAGSVGKTGAAAMTSLSAMRSGAGLVTLCIPESLNPTVESLILEPMTHPLAETEPGILTESALEPIMALTPGKRSLALGPGLGTADGTARLVMGLIERCDVPMIIDADGLNCLAGSLNILKKAKAPLVLTPHPGEMSRLSGISTQEIQKDRISHAKRFAKKFSVIVVLKGARTIIALPDGHLFVNSTGNPGMASGGMGDVLTGVIAGFMTQGYLPWEAACAGVYLHGAAADLLAERRGPIGFLASEVMEAVPEQIRKVMAGK